MLKQQHLTPMADESLADDVLVKWADAVGRPALPRRRTKAREKLVRDVLGMLTLAAPEMERRALERAAARIKR